MTIRTARLTAAVLATIALLAIPARPAHAAAPYLSITTAKTATRSVLTDYVLLAFTETAPAITVRCHKTSRSAASCRATFSSDRLSGSVRSRVVLESRESVTVWLGALRVTAARSLPATTAPTRGIS